MSLEFTSLEKWFSSHHPFMTKEIYNNTIWCFYPLVYNIWNELMKQNFYSSMPQLLRCTAIFGPTMHSLRMFLLHESAISLLSIAYMKDRMTDTSHTYRHTNTFQDSIWLLSFCLCFYTYIHIEVERRLPLMKFISIGESSVVQEVKENFWQLMHIKRWKSSCLACPFEY